MNEYGKVKAHARQGRAVRSHLRRKPGRQQGATTTPTNALQSLGGGVPPPPPPTLITHVAMPRHTATTISRKPVNNSRSLGVGVTFGGLAAIGGMGFTGPAAPFVLLGGLAAVMVGATEWASPFLSPAASVAASRVRRSFRDRREGRQITKMARRHRKAVYADAIAGNEGPWSGRLNTVEVPLRERLFGRETVAGGQWGVREQTRADGTGFVEYRDHVHSDTGRIDIYPGMDLRRTGTVGLPFPAHNKDMRGAKFSNVTFERINFGNSDLRGANMDAMFVRSPSSMEGVNLRGASLRGAHLPYVKLAGADLTGADLTDAVLHSDLREVIMSSEQFDGLRQKQSYTLREVHPDRERQRLGVSQDDFNIMLWSGEVEARDRETNERVIGEFNLDKHFIPSWPI